MTLGVEVDTLVDELAHIHREGYVLGPPGGGPNGSIAVQIIRFRAVMWA